MTKTFLNVEATYCIEDIEGLKTLLDMFQQTADLESKDRKTKKYRVVIEEI